MSAHRDTGVGEERRGLPEEDGPLGGAAAAEPTLYSVGESLCPGSQQEDRVAAREGGPPAAWAWGWVDVWPLFVATNYSGSAPEISRVQLLFVLRVQSSA